MLRAVRPAQKTTWNMLATCCSVGAAQKTTLCVQQGTLTQVAPQQRRRYKPVKMETQQQKEPRTGQGTVSAEDMEGMIVKIPDAGDKQTADR